MKQRRWHSLIHWLWAVISFIGGGCLVAFALVCVIATGQAAVRAERLVIHEIYPPKEIKKWLE